jgi:predicted small integral membrane protein
MNAEKIMRLLRLLLSILVSAYILMLYLGLAEKPRPAAPQLIPAAVSC